MPTVKVANSYDWGTKVIKHGDGVAANDGASKGQVDAAIAFARSRANHTGSQAASTISDFDTQVRTSRLDQMAAPTGPVSFGNQRSTNTAAATADTDVPNWGQVKDLISGLRKTDVRLVATSAHGGSGLANIDGITPIAGDRVLRIADGVNNGIWIASGSTWTRATDADVAAEFATQWLVTVREGATQGDSLWQHNTDGVVTLNTTSLIFNKIGPVSASPSTGFAVNCPVVAAGSNWTINHQLGSEDVIVRVRRVAAPKDFIEVYTAVSDANNVIITPDDAFASGEYRAVVERIG